MSKISETETLTIQKVVNVNKLGSISFVGGEPFLYISSMNQILAGLENLKGIKVAVTTNGSFSKSVEEAIATLSLIAKIDEVRLSYDKFHKEFLPISNVRNLYAACRKLKVDFSVVLTIQSPADICLIKELREIGDFVVGIQKVLSIGRAKRNKVEYKYVDFDHKVLGEMCPNKGKVSYVCGKGFIICDVMIAFDCFKEAPERYSYCAFDKLTRSDLYNQVSTMTFAERLRQSNLCSDDLSPEFSSHCMLCEHILKHGYTGGIK